MRSSASFAMAGPIGARDAALDAMRVAAAADRSVRRAPASRSHRHHVVAEASAGHALAEMVNRAVPFEDAVIGLVVRAVGYGAEREHVGHGEMLSQPGGQQVGAVHHRRPCVEELDL